MIILGTSEQEGYATAYEHTLQGACGAKEGAAAAPGFVNQGVNARGRAGYAAYRGARVYCM